MSDDLFTDDDLTNAEDRMRQEARQPEPSRVLRERVVMLADVAAHTVINPREFHESAERQHALSVAVANVRAALSDRPTRVEPGEGLANDADRVRFAADLWERLPHDETTRRIVRDALGVDPVYDMEVALAAASFPAETPVDQEEPES